jgi:hypothetical protein
VEAGYGAGAQSFSDGGVCKSSVYKSPVNSLRPHFEYEVAVAFAVEIELEYALATSSQVLPDSPSLVQED